MFTKSAFALALILATASGALAATKPQSADPTRNDVYGVRGTYVGSDPDASVRFELRRDSARPE